jgi:hypothetical protein
MSKDNTSPLVWGATAISKEIGKSRQQVYHLITRGALPVTKASGQLVARREDLHDPSRWPRK